ncbi:hypothetical protein L914_21424 [Phytophthora nicotianae]|uniref:Uncharacterized protein n=2 Tax=Phytophthora nicotianae TaxID=4792 RepID=W2M5Q4_PHYNI|nr:hypothetical protein L914_21424 [Phytophthora nicotianae]ETO59333.1 hypothetical protein F444_22291 [Phytophthora nicotianae P1976]
MSTEQRQPAMALVAKGSGSILPRCPPARESQASSYSSSPTIFLRKSKVSRCVPARRCVSVGLMTLCEPGGTEQESNWLSKCTRLTGRCGVHGAVAAVETMDAGDRGTNCGAVATAKRPSEAVDARFFDAEGRVPECGGGVAVGGLGDLGDQGSVIVESPDANSLSQREPDTTSGANTNWGRDMTWVVATSTTKEW